MLSAYVAAAIPSNSFCKTLCFIEVQPFLTTDDLNTVSLYSTGEADEDVLVQVRTTTLVCVRMEGTLEINLSVCASKSCSVMFKYGFDTW
jgi:hypothetical protein